MHNHNLLFSIYYMLDLEKWKWKSLSCIQLFATPGNSPGQNTGVGSLSLLQGIFPTQGSNSALQHYKWILYQLSHQASPRILEWVAFLFSRGSSQPRDWTQVFHIAGGFFTNWATRKPKNTGMGTLLQRIFLNQESNGGLLHCRWILYQLSY